MKTLPVFILFVFLVFISRAQNVAVNTDGSAPDASAILDVKSTSKGVLIPRMTMAQRDAITSPQPGLMIFQSDGVSGFYYNSGTAGTPAWIRVGDVAYPTSSTNRNTYYTASVNTFNVPAGVTRIYFEMVAGGGGCGGTYSPASGTAWGGGGGGGGAFASGYIIVTPGESLTLTVGGAGTNGTNSSTAPTAGTNGTASTIASGASTIILAQPGNGGSPGSAGGPGGGGIGAFPVVFLPARCILTSYVPQVFPGGTGLGITAPAAIQLNGNPGTVSRCGDYNIIGRVGYGVGGGGVVEMTMPYYGMGGGYGSVARQGYIVIYW